jgi:FkbM family methyltransferase
MSRAVGNSGKVFAFEPWPANITDCLAHVRMNRMANVLVPAAVGSTRGLAQFGQTNPVARTGSHISKRRSAWRVLPSTICLRPSFPVPDVIKVDVEGAKSQVLEGARKLLRQHATTWFVVLHASDHRGPARGCLLMPATRCRR